MSNKPLKPPTVCRHCGKVIPKKDNPRNRRRWCLKPKCQEAKKAYERKVERDKKMERKSYAYSKQVEKGTGTYVCKDCGKLTTNRLYCPACRERRLNSVGRTDGDWIYFFPG